MTLSIQPVTKNNWRTLIKLQVREDQSHFVASNLYSIAESKFGSEEADGSHWDLYPYGIYDNETPVGFLMYGYNFQDPDFQAFILRLLVDQNQQGTGYGKFGMEKMLETFRADELIQSVSISYEPNNEAACKLYASLGFVETDKVLDGEVVAIYKMR